MPQKKNECGLPLWSKPFTKPARYKCVYGGRASSKTWSIAHLLILEAVQTPIRVACCREFQSSIKVSAKPALEIAIARMGLSKHFEIQEQTIKSACGSHFFFRGIERNRDEIRGWESVDRIWVEEAQTVSYETAKILIPTIRKPGSELWFTWNPKNRTDWIWDRFIVNPRPGDLIRKVNWDENPWMPDEANEERLANQRENPGLYNHIWNGEPDDEGQENKVLPYAMLLDCVDAYKKGLWQGDGMIDVGLDIADSMVGDYNAMVARKGACITYAEKWRANVIGDTARKASRYAEEVGAVRLYYDAQGVGAGVRSYFAENRSRKFSTRPEFFGGAVKGKESLYSYRVTNADFFARRNAQLGWALRLRAINTKRLLLGEDVNPENCLFIDDKLPDLEQFLAQLSQPTWREGVNGKTELMKRDENEGSPDLYDAAVLAFAKTSERGLKNR